MIISCRDIQFDNKLSRERMNRATQIFGAAVIRRIICFSLYLLGVTRASIARQAGMPIESVKTVIRNIHNNGIGALEDRRRRHSVFLPLKEQKAPSNIKVNTEEQWICIKFAEKQQELKIPRNNRLQVRTLLLTMLNSGLLSMKETSELLELSTTQTRVLSERLDKEDIYSLLDKRQGQKKDYVITAEIKAEMIQQYIVNLACGEKRSGQVLSEQLKERCNLDLSPRTIRFHLERLGLSKIKQTLPKLIASLKKTQPDNK